MSSEILRFTEKPLVDESIQQYEYHEYEPQARTNLNSAGEIYTPITLIGVGMRRSSGSTTAPSL